MTVKSLKIGRFLLTAGLLVILLQGLWQLPDLQDHFFPDHFWALKVQAVNNEDWHIKDGLSSLQCRINYLEWSLAHKASPQRLTADWMLHLPFSEGIRAFSPKFAWNMNIYLASKNKVKVQRKLKNLDALFNNIPFNKKQEFLRDHNNILLNDNDFKKRFTAYNDELNMLKSRLDKLSKVSY
jgi:hypothetical protein